GIRDFHVTGVQTCTLPILTLADVAPLARASATLPESSAVRPNAAMTLEAISADRASSSCPAEARLRTSPMPARIWLVSQPAIPRYSIAWADSVALKAVVA